MIVDQWSGSHDQHGLRKSSPEPIDRRSCKLVCSIGIVQSMTWVDLDPFYAKVKFGHLGLCMGKTHNYWFETTAALGLSVMAFN